MSTKVESVKGTLTPDGGGAEEEASAVSSISPSHSAWFFRARRNSALTHKLKDDILITHFIQKRERK